MRVFSYAATGNERSVRCFPYADGAYMDRTKKEDSKVDYTILPDSIERDLQEE